MTAKLGVVSARPACRALERKGFVERAGGKHLCLTDGRRTVTLPRGTSALHYKTLRLLIKQSGMTVDEFAALVKE